MAQKQYILNNNSGPLILENIPDEVKPGWAVFLLSLFDSYIRNIPYPVLELYEIIEDRNRWKQADEITNSIKIFAIENPSFQPKSYLLLAEKTAKIMCSVSGYYPPSPFNKNNEWEIPYLAMKTATFFDNYILEEEVESTLLLFNRIKNLKQILKTSYDFLLFKKIDDILWINWYSHIDDETVLNNKYQSYIPDIFILKKANIGIETIANRLFQIEKDIIGLSDDIDNCKMLAEIITALK